MFFFLFYSQVTEDQEGEAPEGPPAETESRRKQKTFGKCPVSTFYNSVEFHIKQPSNFNSIGESSEASVLTESMHYSGYVSMVS